MKNLWTFLWKNIVQINFNKVNKSGYRLLRMDEKKIYNLGIQNFIQFNPKSAVYTILMNNEIKMTDKANMSHYIIYF